MYSPSQNNEQPMEILYHYLKLNQLLIKMRLVSQPLKLAVTTNHTFSHKNIWVVP